MTREELLPTLLEIARDVLDEDELEFDGETLFDDIKEWDSLNHIHMVVRMEKTFGIRFEAAQLQRVKKVQELLDIIATLKAI